MEWALVEEQFGRSTNGIYWHIPNAYNVWDHASAEQRERYLRPAIAGQVKDAYAVTERDAGLRPVADRVDGGAHRRRLPDQRREVVRHLRRRRPGADRDGERDRRRREPADAVRGPLRRRRASTTSTIPASPTTIRRAIPTIVFRDVEVGEDAVIGGVGEGNEHAAHVVHRGAPRDRRPRRRGDVAPARRDRRLGHRRASRAAAGSSTTRASRSRSPTRRPTPPPAGC